MEIKLDTLEVINNPAEKRFELWIDGQLSKLDYTIDDDTIMMTHVGVPNEFRGQGLAGVITKAALEYAKAKSLRVIPVCPYVLAYIRRNKQYLELTRSK
jgi:predicted GNAT family acetyltransferase